MITKTKTSKGFTLTQIPVTNSDYVLEASYDHDGKMFSANLCDSKGNPKSHEITMGMWRKCQNLGTDYKDLPCE